MLNRTLLTTLLSLVLLPPALARAAPAADSKPGPTPNAAVKYWQAFALLPTLDKDEEQILAEWDTAPLDKAAMALIGKSNNSRTYLRRGTMLPRCDWQLDYQDGIQLVLPHLARSLTLARLTALHARHQFAQGRWDEGARDVMDLLKLARHVESEPVMIEQLVGYRIESIAIDLAAPHLARLVPVLSPAEVAALPPAATLEQMVRTEQRMGAQWLLRTLRDAEQQKAGNWKAAWNQTFQQPPGESEDGPDFRAVRAVTSYADAIKMLEALNPLYDELAALAVLPPNEFDARLPEFAKKAAATNALAGVILPAMEKIVPSVRRNQAQTALFAAAVAVAQGGPERLKEFKDPFGDGPFEYRPAGKGFELTSKLLFKGKPVRLWVAGTEAE